MARYLVTGRAHADIDEIWDYTAERWGPEQAETYVSGLWRAIERLPENPPGIRSRESIRRGYRSYRFASHVIFFRMRGEAIEVVRVLHQSRDFDRHL